MAITTVSEFGASAAAVPPSASDSPLAEFGCDPDGPNAGAAGATGDAGGSQGAGPTGAGGVAGRGTRGGARRKKLRVAVRPRRVPKGRLARVRFRVFVLAGRRRVPVRNALVRFAHKRVRTNKHGRAVLLVRLGTARGYRALATGRGYTRGFTQAGAVRAVRPGG